MFLALLLGLALLVAGYFAWQHFKLTREQASLAPEARAWVSEMRHAKATLAAAERVYAAAVRDATKKLAEAQAGRTLAQRGFGTKLTETRVRGNGWEHDVTPTMRAEASVSGGGDHRQVHVTLLDAGWSEVIKWNKDDVTGARKFAAACNAAAADAVAAHERVAAASRQANERLEAVRADTAEVDDARARIETLERRNPAPGTALKVEPDHIVAWRKFRTLPTGAQAATWIALAVVLLAAIPAPEEAKKPGRTVAAPAQSPKQQHKVPPVVGQRLDVARSELEEAGLSVEVIGGGTFGVVDESNWKVCETRPAAGTPARREVRAIVDRECGTAGRKERASSTTRKQPARSQPRSTQGRIKQTVKRGVDLGSVRSVTTSPATAGRYTVAVVFAASDNLTQGMIRRGIERDMAGIYEELYDSSLPVENVKVTATFSLTDAYGNSDVEPIWTTELHRSHGERVNYADPYAINWEMVWTTIQKSSALTK